MRTEPNRARGVEEAVEADPLAAAVLEIASERSTYIATATALLAEINAKVSLEVSRDKVWPKDGTRLSNRLRRVAPALRALGVEIELDQHIGRGADKKRAIRIRRVEVGTLTVPAGDAAPSGTVPEKIKQSQQLGGTGDGVDAGDADLPPLSGSSLWETTI